MRYQAQDTVEQRQVQIEIPVPISQVNPLGSHQGAQFSTGIAVKHWG